MTVETCLWLLEAYKKQSEDPVDDTGTPLRGDTRKNAVQQSKKNYEMMKNHILTSKKFRGHPIIEELQKSSEEKEEKKTKSKKEK